MTPPMTSRAAACRWHQGLLANAAVILVTVLALMSPRSVGAWGGDGHRIVAELAERQLSAPARVEVDRLLALEPGATLATVSTWADENRSHSTSAWHYVNLPRGGTDSCTYDAERSCIDGHCVVDAIERQAAVLSSNAPDAARLKALKYVVHFVADVHQPLHGGFADDRGGNQFQVLAFGKGTNLHALWDSGLIGQWPGGSALLLNEAGTVKDAADGGKAPGRWAEESCRIVATEGFYPGSHKIDAGYTVLWAPVLKERLAAAGVRLAKVLNEALGRSLGR